MCTSSTSWSRVAFVCIISGFEYLHIFQGSMPPSQRSNKKASSEDPRAPAEAKPSNARASKGGSGILHLDHLQMFKTMCVAPPVGLAGYRNPYTKRSKQYFLYMLHVFCCRLDHGSKTPSGEAALVADLVTAKFRILAFVSHCVLRHA